MDIADIVSEDYVEFSPDTPVSKLIGTFDDPTVKGVVVRGDVFEGIITRRQLATSHHQPNEKIGSLVWHVPRLAPDEDVRKVAQLMIDSDAQLLPVFDGAELMGVVTADAILKKFQPFLDAATVAEAYTADLVTLGPESTFGDALHVFRENRITHLPVVEDATPIGILSLYDVTDLTVRSATQSQGGDAGGTDSFGGAVSASTGRAHGGFGAREGEIARILDLPVRDVMVSPVRTIRPEATLDTALEEMFAIDGSSLVVTEGSQPFGIVTKTDILDSLTWVAGGNRAVQVYGTDLLDDIQYEEIVAMIEKFDDRDHGMTILSTSQRFGTDNRNRKRTPVSLEA